MLASQRPSPDWDVLHWERGNSDWSGLSYSRDAHEYEDFQDNINDYGISLLHDKEVGFSTTFGRGAVTIKLLYEDLQEISEPNSDGDIEEAMEIKAYGLSFSCGVKVVAVKFFQGSISDGNFEDSESRINFYCYAEGDDWNSHDPATPEHGYWDEMLSDVEESDQPPEWADEDDKKITIYEDQEFEMEAVVYPVEDIQSEKVPPLKEIFTTMQTELREEIKKAGGFEFTSEKFDQRFNLENNLLNDQGELNLDGEGTIYAWIIAYITKEEWLADREIYAKELYALFRQLINSCGIYGHQIGLRISNFIEYATAMEDPFMIDQVMILSLEEEYTDLEINREMAESLVENLSGEGLSLLMKENLSAYLVGQEIKKDLYYEDKYAWIQKIKDALNEYISKDHSIKSNALKDSKKDLKSNKPEKNKQTQASSANEIAKKLFEGNTMNKKKKPKTSGSPAEMAKGLFQQLESDKQNKENQKEDKNLPESYFDDRITPGIELSVFDFNEDNYELGAKTLLCILLKHFTQKEFDPDKLQSDDLLLHLSDFDEMIVKNLSVNVCNHMQEIGSLTNPEIHFTPDDLSDLKVEHVVLYVQDMVNDSESAYVSMIQDKISE